jgi:hypothetical protein
MTLAEILKARGIDDATAKAIQDDMRANKVFTASEENLDVRYGKLKTDHDGKVAELTEAQNLIAELKKASKGQEDLQGKITNYETQVQQLQTENQRIKVEAEAKVGLLAAKAVDVDYLLFKLKEKGELELDDQGKIKGWDDKIAALKTQLPTQFEAEAKKNIIENKLPGDDSGGDAITRESLLKKPYAERMKFYNDNPEVYKSIMNK